MDKLSNTTKKVIEERRREWIKIAKQYGWYVEPFYIQVWVNPDGTVQDTVSFQGMDRDIVILINK